VIFCFERYYTTDFKRMVAAINFRISAFLLKKQKPKKGDDENNQKTDGSPNKKVLEVHECVF